LIVNALFVKGDRPGQMSEIILNCSEYFLYNIYPDHLGEVLKQKCGMSSMVDSINEKSLIARPQTDLPNLPKYLAFCHNMSVALPAPIVAG